MEHKRRIESATQAQNNVNKKLILTCLLEKNAKKKLYKHFYEKRKFPHFGISRFHSAIMIG